MADSFSCLNKTFKISFSFSNFILEYLGREISVNLELNGSTPIYSEILYFNAHLKRG